MAAATWAQRTRVLNRSGYARYDERTSRMLGESSQALMDRYGGDLRKLRREANKDPARERTLLKEFKGIGDVGVDIFFRELQSVWPEIYPFADRKALGAARRLGLGNSTEALQPLANRKQFGRLIGALTVTALEGDYDEIRKEAAARRGSAER